MRKIFINIAFAIGFLAPLAVPSVALAAGSTCGAGSNSAKGEVLSTVTSTAQSGNGCDTSGVGNFVSAVVDILSLVVGIAAIVMIISSGFKFITSGGSAEKVANAKGTLVWAIVGIAVAVLAQLIVHFVINKTSTAAGG